MFDRSIARSTGRSLGGQERARGERRKKKKKKKEKKRRKRRKEEEGRKKKNLEKGSIRVGLWGGGTKFGRGEPNLGQGNYVKTILEKQACPIENQRVRCLIVAGGSSLGVFMEMAMDGRRLSCNR